MIKFQIKKINIFKLFYIIILIFAIFLLVMSPSLAMNTFYDGIRIWATKVLPALLPFFILTKLLSYTSFVSNFGNILTPVTQTIYGVGGSSGYVYLMSVISGYPVGAKLLSDLYLNRNITRSQAITITSFTSTSGPLFILGTVAIGLFNDLRLGIIIILSHYIGALFNGLLYRQKSISKIQTLSTDTNSNFLSESMSNSIASIMSVGGFIALFYMILQLLLSVGLFSPVIALFQTIGLSSDLTTSVICGLIEVTTGAIYLSELSLSAYILAPLLTFLISFGGFSIHAQAYCFLKNFNMPYKIFLMQKFTQSIISTILSIALVFIFV